MGVLISILLATSMVAGAMPDVGLSQAPELVIPETIRVRVTGLDACTWEAPYKVVEMDFKEYVKGVLPAEWGNNWHEESLKAGAMAVKMYAWSFIAVGGKWHDADVYDCNFDQVYKPEWRTEATDRAVDETWGMALLTEEGEPYRTYYDNWYGTCLSRGATDCMGQWNTKKRAEAGTTYEELLDTYYQNNQLVEVEKYVPPVVVEVEVEEKIEATTETVVIEAIPEEIEVATAVAIGKSYYIVKPGDSLSAIAHRLYGSFNPELWMEIYKANLDILKNPNLINVGMELVIPVY